MGQVMHNLRVSAMEDGPCGQLSSIKQTSLLRSDLRVEAVVTNVVKHDIIAEEESKGLAAVVHHDHRRIMKRTEEANGVQFPSKRSKDD